MVATMVTSYMIHQYNDSYIAMVRYTTVAVVNMLDRFPRYCRFNTHALLLLPVACLEQNTSHPVPAV